MPELPLWVDVTAMSTTVMYGAATARGVMFLSQGCCLQEFYVAQLEVWCASLMIVEEFNKNEY